MLLACLLVAWCFSIAHVHPVSVVRLIIIDVGSRVGFLGIAIAKVDRFEGCWPMAEVFRANGGVLRAIEPLSHLLLTLLRWLGLLLHPLLLVLFATPARQPLLLQMLPLRRLSRLLLLRLLRSLLLRLLLALRLGLSSMVEVSLDCSTVEGVLPRKLMVKVNHLLEVSRTEAESSDFAANLVVCFHSPASSGSIRLGRCCERSQSPLPPRDYLPQAVGVFGLALIATAGFAHNRRNHIIHKP